MKVKTPAKNTGARPMGNGVVIFVSNTRDNREQREAQKCDALWLGSVRIT